MPICPTCHTSVDEVISQPTTSPMQSIAPPIDMGGVLPALRQLIYNFNLLNGRDGAPGKNSTQPKKPKVGRYVEQKQGRVTKDVKVFSKQDPETFVTFKQINSLQFKDTVTGETWTWQR